MTEYNLYCDETCHLEHDDSNSMALGAVIVPKGKRKEICVRIKEIKQKHGICATNEVKWAKARDRMLPLYLDLVDYFFDDDDISFRALLIPDKNLLDHEKYNQDHNTWYYKMYFEMLKVVFDPRQSYNVFVDIKDTHSSFRVSQLWDVCTITITEPSRKSSRYVPTKYRSCSSPTYSSEQYAVRSENCRNSIRAWRSAESSNESFNGRDTN